MLLDDNRAIVRAASQASKAADYILSFLSGEQAQANNSVGTIEGRAA